MSDATAIRAVAMLCLVSLPVRAFAARSAADGRARTAETIETGQAVRDEDLSATPTETPKPLPAESRKGRSFLTEFEHWLTLVILMFGALVLIVEYLLLKDSVKTSYELMQLFALNLIITGTLVMISAGYSAEQIAPALGLFGTIAGYLLGRRPSEDEARKKDPPA